MQKELSLTKSLTVQCPTCGAAPRQKCELNSGQPRTDPHHDRVYEQRRSGSITARAELQIPQPIALIGRLDPQWLLRKKDKLSPLGDGMAMLAEAGFKSRSRHSFHACILRESRIGLPIHV
jgi:hypothetical protein